MRIAYVTEVWTPTVNGVVTRLTGTIDELRRDGHQILVVAPRVPADQPDRTVTDGLEVRTVPAVGVPWVYGGQPWGLPLPRVGKFFDEFKPDLVHVVNPACLGVAGVAAARRRHLPLVCSYHTDLAAYVSYYHLGFLKPVVWKALRGLHKRAAVNLVTSGVAGEQLDQARIPRVKLWRRGVDLDQFCPDLECRDGKRRTALYVGRLAEEKELGRLAELAEVPDLRLVVVGDGPARDAVSHQLAGLAVEFTGALHGEDLAAAYRDADVFVFPSRTETLGLVLLEALASGLPVVAADSPASREVLGDCRAARLFTAGRPGDLPAAVGEALKVDRRDAASAARRTVEGFGWAAATSQLQDDYRTALETPVTKRSHRVRDQLWRFITVGASNVIIDLGLFNLFLAIHPTRSPALLVTYNTIAVLAALVNSYWWNSRWTFHHPERATAWSARRGLLFALQGAVNVIVNDLAVAGVSAALTASTLPQQLSGNLSKVAGMIAASLVSFLMMRHVVFKHRGSGRRTERPPTAAQPSEPAPSVDQIERARRLRAARTAGSVKPGSRAVAGGD